MNGALRLGALPCGALALAACADGRDASCGGKLTAAI